MEKLSSKFNRESENQHSNKYSNSINNNNISNNDNLKSNNNNNKIKTNDELKNIKEELKVKYGLISKKRTKQEEEEFKKILEVKHENKETTIDNDKEVQNIINSSAFVTGLGERLKKKRYYTSIAEWSVPKNYLKLKEKNLSTIRKNLKITVEGRNIPPPIDSFSKMKLPKVVIKALNFLKIIEPTSIQMQCLPIILSGRDVLAVAGAGLGKSFVFIIPILMLALYEELKNPIGKNNTGPFAAIIVPNRELANQINDLFEKINSIILPKFKRPIKVALCIGGVKYINQHLDIQNGVHLVVGTPGRLSDLMSKKRINTNQIKILVFDEADRLIDKGFDEDIKKLTDNLTTTPQTILTTSNMPKRIQELVKTCLYDPITINVGKGGTVNINVKQDIEFVKEESKLLHLLETLQKTPPPVLIFCDNKNDVDQIHEFLLLKGLDVCAIHGDKEQFERTLALREIKEGIKDILVCTDIVSKGVDFQDVEHIINYDLPREIENYILRLGRCGRSNKVRGIVTTYISKNADEAILLDLKHLLLSAGQPVPILLESLQPENPDDINKECPFCGVLGHKLEQCHKLEIQKQKAMASKIKQSVFK